MLILMFDQNHALICYGTCQRVILLDDGCYSNKNTDCVEFVRVHFSINSDTGVKNTQYKRANIHLDLDCFETRHNVDRVFIQ